MPQVKSKSDPQAVARTIGGKGHGALTTLITEPRYPELSRGKIPAPCTLCTEKCKHATGEV
jgi:hypothetical protein